MSKTNDFFSYGTKALVSDGSKGAIAELVRRSERGSARATKALEGLTGKAKALWGCVALEANTPVAPEPEPEPEAAPSVLVQGHVVSQSLAEALVRNVGMFFQHDDEEWQTFLAAVRSRQSDNDEADMPRDLAGLKVAELRDLAKEHGIVVPKGTRKAGLVALLDSSLDALDCEGDDGVPF